MKKIANLRRMAASKNEWRAKIIDDSDLSPARKRQEYIKLLGFIIPPGGGGRYRKRKSKRRKSKKKKSKKKKSKTRRRRR